MKKLQFFTALALIGSLFSCNPKPGIKGEIKGLGNDTVFVHYKSIDEFYSDDLPKVDTVYSKNGNFEFSPQINKLTIFFFIPSKLAYTRPNGSLFFPQYICLFADNKESITISGRIGEQNVMTYNVTGSELNKECSELRNNTQEEKEEILRLDLKMYNTKDKKQSAALLEKRKKSYNEGLNKYTNYIKENPDSQYSGFLVARYFGATRFEEYYKFLNPSVQKGEFSPMLNYWKMVSEAKRKIAVGSQAPYFKLKTLEGKDFTLDDITNKQYIILDFWGSWCGACVKGLPKMKEYYKKYKDQIEIVGIDCRDTDEKWKKAVADHKLSWKHVKNDKTNVNYAVKGYPTKIILDKSHKIVGIFLGEEEDFYKKLDELLKETN